MKSKVIDMAGKRYGSVTGICLTGKATSGDLKWEFQCDCGIKFEANGYYVRSGKAFLAPIERDGSIEFNGIKDTYAGWSKRTGIKTSTIAMRISSYGWSIEKSLTKGAISC